MILPRSGKVFVSVRDEDKEGVLAAAQGLKRCGFSFNPPPAARRRS